MILLAGGIFRRGCWLNHVGLCGNKRRDVAIQVMIGIDLFFSIMILIQSRGTYRLIHAKHSTKKKHRTATNRSSSRKYQEFQRRHNHLTQFSLAW
jgi:hypothetical protein